MDQERTDPLPLLRGRHSYASVSDQISDVVLTRTPRWWYLAFLIAFAGAMGFFFATGWLFVKGVGIWGVDIPVAWGFAITNFVWWIGIGHAGTFISAILLLLRQDWRTSINRFAEAMTIFAAGIAGLWPILHLGRPWFFYWLAPYPNVMHLWPQWRSPLVWDFFAISTYITVSLLFWYMGLIPDLATLRDRATGHWRRLIYGALSLGWRGEARQWHRYETTYLLLAGIATPLVISVHSVVSLDFAVGNTPGWHSTLFPPYFVAGALFSGFAMVLTLAIPLRAAFRLHDFITTKHLDHAARIMLATGMLVAYGYLMENFTAFYSGDRHEIYIVTNRLIGPYAPVYWTLLACNVAIPQLLWFRGVRLNVGALLAVSIVVNVGMWLERFMIIVTSQHRDYLPSAWGMFYPTGWDLIHLFGSIALFFALFLLFVRFLPSISIAEMRREIRDQGQAR
jgi:molybdopterin-containing oxidoreductase family membrane subunit